jgi:hypothetical protein
MIRLRASAVLVAIAVATCACSSSRNGTATSPAAAKYLTIAEVGNRGLGRAFDALDERDHDNLVAARADLRAAAEIERTFDRSLTAIAFPPAIKETAGALVRVNEARAAVASKAAASPSLQELRGYEGQLSAANAAVEKEVRTLRHQLGLPPPETS